mmetsp:Transcript_23846/g.42033  ORF Transcript_23846/g.42033 Transcript_23846/m.42033 type:complete len:288 (+) Transcript_23846:145-1008(+)
MQVMRIELETKLNTLAQRLDSFSAVIPDNTLQTQRLRHKSLFGHVSSFAILSESNNAIIVIITVKREANWKHIRQGCFGKISLKVELEGLDTAAVAAHEVDLDRPVVEFFHGTNLGVVAPHAQRSLCGQVSIKLTSLKQGFEPVAVLLQVIDTVTPHYVMALGVAVHLKRDGAKQTVSVRRYRHHGEALLLTELLDKILFSSLSTLRLLLGHRAKFSDTMHLLQNMNPLVKGLGPAYIAHSNKVVLCLHNLTLAPLLAEFLTVLLTKNIQYVDYITDFVAVMLDVDS